MACAASQYFKPHRPSDQAPAVVKLAAFNHFDECSELIEIDTAHGYKHRLLFL